MRPWDASSGAVLDAAEAVDMLCGKFSKGLAVSQSWAPLPALRMCNASWGLSRAANAAGKDNGMAGPAAPAHDTHIDAM